MGCCWPMYNVTWYLYPYHDIENTEPYNWKYTRNPRNQTASNHPIHQHGHTNVWYIYVSEKEFILISKNAAIMCGMYIINGEYGPEPKSSEGNTSSNPKVSALIPRPAFNRMEKTCQRHRSNQNSHPPVLVRKPLCNQFIHYHLSSRGVYGINHFKLRNFAVIATECYFATVGRGSIMARIHSWSVMIYGSLQAEFEYNSHIDMYGTSLVKLSFIYLNRLTLRYVLCGIPKRILWRALKFTRLLNPPPNSKRYIWHFHTT